MKYLLETTENYRVDSEEEAKQLIEEAKKGDYYTLKKYTTQYKEKKIKGEVADSWYRVTLVKSFTEEKEPVTSIDVTYDKGSAF
jgi:hypothetical protein